VLVVGFPAAAFGTNCYVLAPADGEECVVVDPGIGVTDALDEVLAAHRLRPVAALLTHGHLDHTFSVVPVCGARGITAYIHPDDAQLLADPGKGLGTDLTALLGGALPNTEPDDVAPLADGMTLALAGLELTVDHAPGHTGGSVMFRAPGGATGSLDGRPVVLEATEVCLSGDVLFAGSVGRVDLPGGSAAAMADSLRHKVLPLADTVAVLPGHGPNTTIGRERRGNLFLRRLSPETV
jgi:glyoxylase-like metal-dependent hydrolase (beta-lactamase superfamily II)